MPHRNQQPKKTTREICLDLDREKRCGFPEAIYAEGKTSETLIEAFQELKNANQNALATRVSQQQADALVEKFPDAIYNSVARTVRLQCENKQSENEKLQMAGKVVVVTAGTTDLPVAEEAMETLRWMQVEAELIVDVGVAGPQRVLNNVERLQAATAIVVVAGMEGALPSVVAGWVACPVIACPTSVGYGASFQGVAALLSMLNSCAANVAVVNIDAGFKAAHVAGLIVRGNPNAHS